MSGRLILVRHGQSYGNVERRLDTKPPGAPLTELGMQQARLFAEQYEERPPAVLVHSVALRAIQTASGIAEHLGVPALQAEGLHEVQAGELEDRSDLESFEIFDRVYERWHFGDVDARMPGGESAQDVFDRYLPVVADLRRRHLENDASGGDVVIVSHGAAIRLVAAALAGVDPGFAVNRHLLNTEAVVLAPITDGRWSCVHWGEAAAPFPHQEAASAEELAQSADPMG
ncbi:histidine phosphatase family protein [Mycobacterium sp. NPDC050853]|uniref:histidine phosphatase family protein n=1 Tax=Mycobacteriaceae TaxID=1762 RepID=UPI0015DD8F35|nr:histidine phosphatase family protein [Mycobacteroides sp. LB1]